MRFSAVQMSLKVYYDLMSQPSRAVWLFLKSTNIPHEEKEIALRKGEHMNDEYQKIHPFQKVPVIDHDGFRLTESVAILRYLCSQFGSSVPEHWYPSDLQKRARVDEFMAWQHTNLRIYGSMYFQTRIIIPQVLGGKPVDEKKLADWKNRLDECLDGMERVFLQSDFINGAADITIADLLAVCELEQPIAGGLDITDGRPIIKGYMDRVKQRLGANLYEQAHFVARKVNQGVKAGKL